MCKPGWASRRSSESAIGDPARYPELVRALVIEDVGAVMRKPEVEHPMLDVRGWFLANLAY